MTRPLKSLFRPAAWLAAAVLGGLVLPVCGRAQVAVTSMTTSTSDRSDRSVNGVDFQRTTISIDEFKDVAGNIYDANTVATSAYIRRNTTVGNADNSSVWYTDATTAGDFKGTYATSYDELLLGNNILRGSDNTFANGTTAADGNIERLDFIFSDTGIISTTSTSFAVFDRGAVGVHDSVKIAVITGWNSTTDVPTAYSGILVNINSANYGTANLGADFNYHLFRSDNGSNLGDPDYWNANSESGSQGLGGTVISMSDLGIAAGTRIYGYSLMAYDVTTGGNMTNLVDWTNTTYYASNTSNATGTGGIDLSAVNGVLYNRRVPEPSTYGAIFIGLTAAFFGWRRYRRGVSVAAA